MMEDYKFVEDFFGDIWFGTELANDTDWRSGSDIDEDPDDEELAVTPKDVIMLLGFDPKEFSGKEVKGLSGFFLKGGAGSGNFNHEGRPGQIGGSGEGGERNNTDEQISQKVNDHRLLTSVYGYDVKEINFNGMSALDRLRFDYLDRKNPPEFAFTVKSWDVRDQVCKGLSADALRKALRQKGLITDITPETPSSHLPNTNFIINNDIVKGLSDQEKEVFIEQFPKHIKEMQDLGLKSYIEYYPRATDGFSVSQLEKMSDNFDKVVGRSGLKLKEDGMLDYNNQMDVTRERLGAFSNDKEVALHRLLSSWAMIGGGTPEQKMMRETSNQVFPLNRNIQFYNGVKDQRDEQPFYSLDRVRGHLETLKLETEQFYKNKFSTKKDPNPDLSIKTLDIYRGVGGHLEDGYRPAAVESWSTQQSSANKFGKMMAETRKSRFGHSQGKGAYSLLSANVSYDKILWSYESVKGKYGWPPEAELKGKKEFVVLGGAFKDNLIKMEKLYD